jgi:hypothetical protein
LVLKFNYPIDPEKIQKISISSYSLDDYKIEVKKTETIESVKKRISDIVKIDINNFIMKKHNFNGIEVKNLSEKVETITHQNMALYLQLGNPTSEGKYCFKTF